jgi:F-type H+-transporting ATPase subunit epsilon
MAFFNLNLFTPQGTVVQKLECDALLIPTVRGQINVLPEHTHFLTQLQTGILTAKTSQGERFFSVTAGTCKVLKNDVTVLSFTSETAQQIDLARAQKAKELAEKKLKGGESLTDIEIIKYQRKLERAEARIKLAYLRGQ